MSRMIDGYDPAFLATPLPLPAPPQAAGTLRVPEVQRASSTGVS